MSATGDVVLTITTASDADFAPGRTFAMSFDALRRASASPGTGTLPEVLSPNGYYNVAPSVASDEVHWNLAAMPGQNVSLPVSTTATTFAPRTLANPDGTLIDVTALALPPVLATVQQGENGGPGGGPTTKYTAADLQPGTYLRTVTPAAPFRDAFGPAIASVPISNDYDYGLVSGYDTTGTVDPALPTATITRERGSFDGWTAYLRDTTTGAVASNVAPLSGQSTTVTFAVRRIASPLPDGGAQLDEDALANAVLVVAPPAGSIEPAYLGNIINDVLATPRYPTLPAPVVVEGVVLGPYGEPVSAELVFEAIGITNVVAGQPQLDTQSFALTRFVSNDPASGQYSVTLPPGRYRFDVRPISTSYALLERDLEVPVQFDPLEDDVALGTPTSTQGAVAAADGRTLPGTVVEAISAGCAPIESLDAAPPSAWCLPRPAQATTDADGGFDLELDPGSYILRAEPTPGTRLPWVTTGVIDVTSTTASDAGTIVVPVPLSLGLVIVAPDGNPVPGALVRAYRMTPAQGAVELGDALTDANGRYDLYVAPSH
jgi:hypothetical protein